MRPRRFLVAIGLALLLTLVGSSPRAIPPAEAALNRAAIRRVIKSVVQLIAVDLDRRGQFTPKWNGSGTIVSADGLILTNCHVVLPRVMIEDDPRFDYDALVVSLTTRSDQPPSPTYQAELVQCDRDLDLAVIQIVKALDGTRVDSARLNLPTVPVGDSDQVEIGDPLYIFGYPDIGGETITFTAGNVSGFTSERGVTGRAWIKTDATIAGGNSGGTAVNEDGELIAVPTQMGAGSTGQVVDCRPVADTNNDGVLDEKDTCVPTGGFINALRPINLAKPMIEAAGRGLGKRIPEPGPGPEPPEKEGARVSRLIFAPAVNDYDQPVTVADSFPSGTEDIYLFFDYEEFQDGVPWSAELIYENGVYTDTWPVRNWDGGPSGIWWIGYGGQVLDDGTYEFTLYYDNEAIGSAEVEVGGPARKLPTFSNIQFSGGGESGYLLPAGIQEVKATFEYANMTRRTEWSNVWYHEGKDIFRADGEPPPNPSGTGWRALVKRKGFDPGRYRLELYIGDRLAATSDFLVVGEKEPERDKEEKTQALFGPITFASQVDRDDNPMDPGTSFPSGIDTLYGIFDYQGMQDGWKWTRRWSIDGEVVLDNSDTWQLGEQGENFLVWIYSRAGALPDGEYKLELSVQGQLVQSGVATVGSGRAQPTPTPAPRTQRVEVFGHITDADTGRGIAGALFLVLKPGITVDEFRWTEEEVYTWTETDRRGYYELSAPLLRGQSYSILIGARGYKLVARDGFPIPEDVESPWQLDFKLQTAR